MNQQIVINIIDIIPDSKDVFLHQGIPEDSVIPDHIISLFEEAVTIFKEKSKPVAKLKTITISEFDEIFEGERRNEDTTPLENIYPQSDNLAIFALTLGNDISDNITTLFDNIDFALGAMLDSVTSMAADKAVEVLVAYFYKKLSEEKLVNNDSKVLSYSPGYCGWDLSGQKKLFKNLNPEEIGITINESFLMTPLKSVSGVLVHGNKEIHVFESSFIFCSYCKNQTCRARIEKIKGNG